MLLFLRTWIKVYLYQKHGFKKRIQSYIVSTRIKLKKVFYWSWNCGPFEVERNSRFSPILKSVHSGLSLFYVESHSVLSLFFVESHSEFSPFAVKPLSELSLCWVPFWVQSNLCSVHSEISLFGFESIRCWVHLGLSPFGLESIRAWVHSGFSPIRSWVHSDKIPILGSVVLGSVVLGSVGESHKRYGETRRNAQLKLQELWGQFPPCI